MNKETAFFVIILCVFGTGLLGVGLIISAFVGRKFTLGAKVRAVIGGVLTLACIAAVLFVLR